MNSVGVVQRSAYFSGDCFHILSRFVWVVARICRSANSVPMSLVPYMLTKFAMPRWDAAAAKRFVWPIIQLVMKPP